MADNSIIIEIEFNGQKGYAKLSKDIVQTATDAGESAAKGFGDSFASFLPKALGGVSKAFGAFAIGTAAVAAFGFAAKKAFDELRDVADTANEVKKVNEQFDFLANKAGGAADLIRGSFERLNNGLVDTEDFLKASNTALVNLNGPVTNLGKNFEAARKIAVGFGVDTLDAYQAINQAVATGQTRVLRQIGLYVDATSAVEGYARSIGVASKFLTDVQKESALFEAIQKKVNENFGNVDLTTRTLSESFKAFGTATRDLGESISVALTKIFGPGIQAILDAFTEKISLLANEVMAKYGSGTAAVTAEQEAFAIKTKQLTKELADLETQQKSLSDTEKGFAGILAFKIEATKTELANIRQQSALIDENKRKLEASTSFQQQAAGIKRALTEDEIQKIKELKKAREEAAQSQRSTEESVLEFQIAHATTQEEVERIRAKGIQDINADTEFKVYQIKRQYAELGLQGTQEAINAEQAIRDQGAQRLQQWQEKTEATLMKAKQIAQSAIVGGIASSFSALGAALVKGKNGFEAFGKAVIGALGAMAIQIGTLLVTIGLGFQTLGPVLPVFGLSGTAAVAAGIGLIVLGGALQAIAGGEGELAGGAAGGGVGGGGGIGGGATGTSFEQPQVEQQKPKTEVVVNVEGNIFNGAEQARTIAENLQEYFDTNNGLLVRS